MFRRMDKSMIHLTHTYIISNLKEESNKRLEIEDDVFTFFFTFIYSPPFPFHRKAFKHYQDFYTIEMLMKAYRIGNEM